MTIDTNSFRTHRITEQNEADKASPACSRRLPKKMSTAKSHHLLRSLVILSSGFYFLVSFVYGAGRGMSSIPAGYEGLAILKVATYTAILIGALSLPRRLNIAVFFLALGIAGRSFLELRTSVARSWIDSGADFDITWALLVALMYVLTFLFPFLLLGDTIRLIRRSRDNIPTNKTGEQGADGDAEEAV